MPCACPISFRASIACDSDVAADQSGVMLLHAGKRVEEWILRDAGRSTFRLVHKATGRCAEQVNDDGAPGGRVALADCADQQRQVWTFLRA
jgi:hypothetical protein